MSVSNVQLWIIGSIGIDEIATPFETRRELLGGSVTYACATASFFTPVGAVGVVGDDFPAAFLARYTRFGIDTSGLQTRPGATFRWSGVYDADMINRRTLKTELGVFGTFSPELPEHFRAAPFVMLGNIMPDLQLHVLDQVQGRPFVAVDTMDYWIQSARPALEQVIKRADVLTLNDTEARLLTGRHHLLACARDILKMGPQYVVIKKGEHGAMLFSKEGIGLIPAFPVDDLKDPTGAGDSFAGGFMGFLAQTRATRVDESMMRRALLHGSVVASFGVEAFSTERLERLQKSEIDARVAALRRMIDL